MAMDMFIQLMIRGMYLYKIPEIAIWFWAIKYEANKKYWF